MQEPTPEQLEQMMREWKPLEVTGDAIPWSVFAQTKEIEECKTDAEGYINCILKPEYSKEVLALDNQQVTLMGYMFPLQDADGQQNFIFGPYPLSCPFHYHVGPSQNVEVLADEAIAFSYDPVTIEGTMRIRFNADTGVFFYLENATAK